MMLRRPYAGRCHGRDGVAVWAAGGVGGGAACGVIKRCGLLILSFVEGLKARVASQETDRPHADTGTARTASLDVAFRQSCYLLSGT